jgi:hypothetical protein
LLPEAHSFASPTALDGEQFGQDVSIDEGVLAVNCFRCDVASLFDVGSVYVYEEPQTGWATLAAPATRVVQANPQIQSEFGIRVLIEHHPAGDRLVVGARSYDHNGMVSSGAAYVVDEPVAGWSSQPDTTPTHQLLPSQLSPGDELGTGLALDGGRVVVGSVSDDPYAQPLDSGRAFVFDLEGNAWAETHWLQGSPVDHGGTHAPALGHGIALQGSAVLVGAHLDDHLNANDSGSVYAFQLEECHVDLFCFCTAGGGCSNADPVAGCKNSTNAGGLLVHGAGATSITSDDLELYAVQLPTQKSGIFFMGIGTTSVPFFDGRRCVAAGTGSLYRHSLQSTGPHGVMTLGPGIVSYTQIFAPGGHIQAGDTWHFQAWYRDPMGPCGFGTNVSNAISVTFQP